MRKAGSHVVRSAAGSSSRRQPFVCQPHQFHAPSRFVDVPTPHVALVTVRPPRRSENRASGPSTSCRRPGNTRRLPSVRILARNASSTAPKNPSRSRMNTAPSHHVQIQRTAVLRLVRSLGDEVPLDLGKLALGTQARPLGQQRTPPLRQAVRPSLGDDKQVDVGGGTRITPRNGSEKHDRYEPPSELRGPGVCCRDKCRPEWLLQPRWHVRSRRVTCGHRSILFHGHGTSPTGALPRLFRPSPPPYPRAFMAARNSGDPNVVVFRTSIRLLR